MSIVSSSLQQLLRGEMPNRSQAEALFAALMHGEANDAQISALLMGFAILGETPELLAGAASAMRLASKRIHVSATSLIDTCGTGGDGASTFNISTTVAILLAACGQGVAKHGNRAISSRSGSADVLEALGVNLDCSTEQVSACIEHVGIGFMFAPNHHPAMRHVAKARKDLGMRSVFNLLGPLSNPAAADFQIIGVYSKDKMELMANSLQQLGCQRALIVHGRDGLDEITITDKTDAILIETDAAPRHFEIDPTAFGMPLASSIDLMGGNAEENAAILRSVLKGEQSARSDIVLLNTAAALWVCGKASSIDEGIQQAYSAIQQGKAIQTLDKLIAYTQKATS